MRKIKMPALAGGRLIVERTAQLVAQKGAEFEKFVLATSKATTGKADQFSFLLVGAGGGRCGQ
jgi:hypothetical protein